jgi:hypothetical protein
MEIMKKRTQRKPLIFEIEGSKFRSTALGFLEANEVLLTYLPTIIDLVADFNSVKEEKAAAEVEEETADMADISKMFSKVDKKLITSVCNDLLYQTEFQDPETEDYSFLDPNDFDSIQECLQVIWRVFQYNFPDFFGKGEGTIQELPTPQTALEEKKTVPEPEKKVVTKRKRVPMSLRQKAELETE